MIIPDINLLLYAYDAESLFHSQAVGWWEGLLSGTEPVGLLPVVVFGFVRIGTNLQAFRRPMSVGEAAGHVRSWLEQTPVEVLDPGAGQVESVLKLLQDLGTAGNLVTDAQIATAALAQGATVHTTDADFVRLSGVKWFNPITGLGSSNSRPATRA